MSISGDHPLMDLTGQFLHSPRQDRVLLEQLVEADRVGVSELLVRRYDPPEGLCDTWCGTTGFVPKHPDADAAEEAQP